MDFPDNATTNVHQINGIISVRWSLYSLEAVNPSDAPEEGKTQYLPDDASHLLITTQAETQRNSEYELRSSGYHVLSDTKKNDLWIFDLPKAVTSMAPDNNDEKIFYILNSPGTRYKKTTNGTLDATDLYVESAKTPSFSPSNSNNAERINTLAFGVNSSIGSIHGTNDSKEPHKNLLHFSQQDFASVYTKMIEAVSLSITYILVKNLSYSPLGSGSYIKSLLPSASKDLIDETLAGRSQLGSSLMSVSIRWWPSGVLTISSSQVRLPELKRVLDSFNGFPDLKPAKKSIVVLSPSGRTARYLGEFQVQSKIEDKKQKILHLTSDPLRDSINETKLSIITGLAQLGINLPPKEVWLRLQYDGNSFVRDDTENWQEATPPSGTFIWPASLCFCRIGNEDHQSFESLKIVISSDNNPLSDAESWYNAKSTREELIESASRQNQVEIKIKKELSGIDEDDGLSDFVPRTNQYISTQEANSIYPTPPDALRTQAVSSSNHETHPPSGELSNARGAIGDQAHEGSLAESPFLGSLDPIVSSTPYDAPDSTDLFDEIDGEMDSELFTDNVLTEADFSFFDKPDIEDSMSNREYQADNSADEEVPIFPFQKTYVDAKNDIATGNRIDAAMSGDKLAPGDAIISERLIPGLISDDNTGQNRFSSQNRDNIVCQKQLTFNPVSQTIKNEPMVQAEDIVEATAEDHKASFRSVSFREKLREFDIKYAKQGRFGYEPEDDSKGPISQELANLEKSAIPRIGIHSNKSFESSEDDVTSSSLALDSSENESDSNISESLSKPKATEAIEESSMATSRKRKRDQEETNEDAANPSFSNNSSKSETKRLDGSVSYFHPSMFKPNTDLSYNSVLSTLLRNLQPNFPKYNGSDRRFIQVAQIVVEQLVLHTEFTSELSCLSLDYSQWNGPILHEYSSQETMSQLCPRSERCNLKNYFSIEKGVSESVIREIALGRPSQRDQPPNPKPKTLPKVQSDVIKLPAPFTRIQRNQIPMELLAPALYFWEELGLGPSHGEKDVLAICICPAIDSALQGAVIFLDMLGSAYQSCKLGSHKIAPDSIGCCNGMLPASIGDGSFINVMDQLNEICEKLGNNMGHLNAEGGNTVVYMINPFTAPQSIPYLCSAFLKIFETYALTLKTQPVMNPNDLILQIIPLDLISSPNTIVLPSPLAYRSLAFEVYDRCPPNTSSGAYGGSRHGCAPSIQLAREMPKMINLKLSPEPTASLLQSDMCFHLAYAWDPTQEWLTASWTDNQGDVQWNTPYCLGVGEIEECWPMLLNIIKEIWETTLEMLHPRNSPWRLFVVKDSPMQKRELEAWLLVCTQSSLPTLTCTFLTVNTNPPLQFPPLLPLEKLSFPLPYTYNTPGSTPAAHVVSPDTSVLVSTPSGNQANTPTPSSGLLDTDTDAKLIDITDESWSLVFQFPTTDPLLPSSICPPIASGYLLKRAGTRDEDGLIAVEVDIVHGDLKGKETVLKEVLSMYRGLAALARLRNVVDRVTGVLPWHVATTRRAGDGVNSLMSWNGDGD